MLSFLGTSGQNVDDLARWSGERDRLRLAARTLHWRHLCPSAPDTLGGCAGAGVSGSAARVRCADCYPLAERDPLVLTQCPHVYFVGNQPAFGHARFGAAAADEPASRQVLVVALPSFARTGLCGLVNLRDLSVQAVAFAAPDQAAIPT